MKQGSLFLILLCQIAGAQPTDPKFSACLDSCFTVCNAGPASLAWGCRENCGERCQHANDVRPTPYGAIAFGTRGAEGISWSQGTWATANNLAIANCERYGTDCKVVYHFQNTCAALAVAKGGQHYEAATGDTAKKAEANATAACQQHWGTCASDLSACSSASVAETTRSNPPAQPHATSWGAIAYSSPDMQSGWANSKSDQALAESEAMKMCATRQGVYGEGGVQ